MEIHEQGAKHEEEEEEDDEPLEVVAVPESSKGSENGLIFLLLFRDLFIFIFGLKNLQQVTQKENIVDSQISESEKKEIEEKVKKYGKNSDTLPSLQKSTVLKMMKQKQKFQTDYVNILTENLCNEAKVQIF